MMTRRNVASHLAAHLVDDRATTIEAVAAWLVATKRTRQVPYVVRQVTAELQAGGYVYAEATTARQASHAAREMAIDYITSVTDAKEVELVERIDPAVIGGLRLDLPEQVLDGTIKQRLKRLEELGT